MNPSVGEAFYFMFITETKNTKSYILRFNKSVSGPVSHMYGDRFHYFGKSENYVKRFERHTTGRGSVITKRAYNEGVRMKIAFVINGDCEKSFKKFKFRYYCGCDICTRILAWDDSSGDYVI